MIINDLIAHLSTERFSLHNEKVLQREVSKRIPMFEREFRLDAESVIDFFHEGIGIEVKIKGTKRSIYDQCARYCRYGKIGVLILLTNKSIGLPESIQGKPVYVINLSKAWL